jgi:hypothetical protein
MLQKMPHGDLLRCDRVGNPKCWQVALHRSIQLDLAGLDQLHNRQCSNRLARRGQHEGCLRRDCPAALICFAIAAEIDDTVVLDKAQGQAGNTVPLHLLAHECINLGNINSIARCGSQHRTT